MNPQNPIEEIVAGFWSVIQPDAFGTHHFAKWQSPEDYESYKNNEPFNHEP